MLVIRRNSWKTLFYILCIVLFFVFILKQRQELYQTLDALRYTNGTFLLLGLFGTGLLIICQALLFQSALRSQGKQVPVLTCASLYLKRFFLSSFLPAGYSVAQYTLNNTLEPYGVSSLESSLASTVFILIGFVSYIIILIPTILYATLANLTSPLMLTAAGVVIVLTILMVWEFFLFTRSRGLTYFLTARLFPTVKELMQEWQQRELLYKQLWIGLFWSICVDIMGSALVFLAIMAVHEPANILAALIGYIMTILILTVSPIFQGIVVLEFSLSLTLSQFGLPQGTAIAATLIFRFLHMWVPMILGGVLLARRQFKPWINRLLKED
jgi:uncharacterized membrane protein YbhN (UPF0104 family)